MASGLLTGRFDSARVEALAADDWRRRSPEFTEPRLARNVELVDRLRPIAQDLGIDLPALAVAWVLATDGVTGAIVGARRPDQIEGWITAGEVELSGDDLAAIELAVKETGAGSE
jgi:aryl-alcohol dehydrogenase-like predicted oxidoreductase